VLNFLKERIWNPLVQGQNYNPFNTLFYALLFIAVVEAYWRLFAGKPDQKKFRRAAVPFIVLGGLLRFADTRLLPHNILLVTPGVYLLVLAAFSVLYRFVGAEGTFKAGVAASAVLLLLELPLLHFAEAVMLVPVLLITWAVTTLYGRIRFMKDRFAWVPHVFEAWVTSFGVYAGLMEEHVIAGALMGYNPFLFGLVKTALLPLIMWLLRDTEKKQKVYVGTVIGLLGLGPGVRDLMELLSLGG